MATKTLVLYSSVEGQTLKIINYISDFIEGEKELFDVDLDPEINFEDYDNVLLGASIRYGHVRKSFLTFVNKHHVELDLLPHAFFLVCLTARNPEKAKVENNTYMQKFLQQSSWKPQLMAVFAGALLYSRYNWWQTLLIQLIMKMTGGNTDKSKDIELTDWSSVKVFSRQFAKISRCSPCLSVD